MFDGRTPTIHLHAAPGAARALAVRDYGTRAVAARLVSQVGLDLAIAEATRLKTALPDALIAAGQVSERQAYELLAEITGLPLIELQQAQPAVFACRLVPERIARRHLIIPVQEDNRTLTYATSRPFDPEADRDVAFTSGRRAAAVLAMPSHLTAALDRCYPRAGEIDCLLSRLSVEVRSRTGSALAHSADPDSASVALCRRIVSGALDAGASDIHIEPFADRADVRYRVSGILEPVLAIPKDAVALVVNRFKVMARTNIALHHLPQDGAFRVSDNANSIDVRLSTLPTVHGEKVVMRLVDGHSPLKSLESLGYDPVTLARLRRALARPDGLILFTGPTATGKTTALYAALHALLTGRTNIVSVEDPVERYVEGVNQSAVNVKAGNTFAAVLRSVLRQDPNVIMVGEIRDAEVAQIVGQAAFTGHLVLSSLHTTDAAAAVARLQHLGLEPFRDRRQPRGRLRPAPRAATVPGLQGAPPPGRRARGGGRPRHCQRPRQGRCGLPALPAHGLYGPCPGGRGAHTRRRLAGGHPGAAQASVNCERPCGPAATGPCERWRSHWSNPVRHRLKKSTASWPTRATHPTPPGNRTGGGCSSSTTTGPFA